MKQAGRVYVVPVTTAPSGAPMLWVGLPLGEPDPQSRCLIGGGVPAALDEAPSGPAGSWKREFAALLLEIREETCASPSEEALRRSLVALAPFSAWGEHEAVCFLCHADAPGCRACDDHLRAPAAHPRWGDEARHYELGGLVPLSVSGFVAGGLTSPMYRDLVTCEAGKAMLRAAQAIGPGAPPEPGLLVPRVRFGVLPPVIRATVVATRGHLRKANRPYPLLHLEAEAPPGSGPAVFLDHKVRGEGYAEGDVVDCLWLSPTAESPRGVLRVVGRAGGPARRAVVWGAGRLVASGSEAELQTPRGEVLWIGPRAGLGVPGPWATSPRGSWYAAYAADSAGAPLKKESGAPVIRL
jgi:hypothetical protein